MTPRAFFSRYAQQDIPVRQYRGKSPMFFRDAHLMGAAFTADLKSVKEALPDSPYQPLEVFPGTAVVAIHCMEYKDTDIGPYNEVSLSIAIRRGLLPSPLSLLRSVLTRNYHAYVQELPVNTEAALYGGLDYFNYPKYLADISFRETASRRVCTLRDRESLDLILEFEGGKIRTGGPSRKNPEAVELLTLNTYPRKDNRTCHARMLVNQRERGTSLWPDSASLRLGGHPRAEPFRKLRLGWPLHYLFAPRCEAILFMPAVLRG